MSAPTEIRHKWGNYLFWFAWGIEIGAACVGLALAWYFLGIQLDLSKKPDGSLSANDWLLAFVSAIPFVMVAAIELTKIPFAYACYLSISRVAKYVFAFALFLLTAITFETFINGFLQSVQVQLNAITKIQLSMDKTSNEKTNLERDKAALAGLSRKNINTTHAEEMIKINQREERGKQAILEERRRNRARLGGLDLKLLRDQVDQLKKKSEIEKNHYQSRKREIENSFSGQQKAASTDTKQAQAKLKTTILSIRENIERFRRKIDQKENEIRDEEGKGNVEGGGEAKIRTKYASRVSTKNENIKGILKKIGQKENEIGREESKNITEGKGIKKIRDKYRALRKRARELTENKRAAIKKKIDQKKEQLKGDKTERRNNFLPDIALNERIEQAKLRIDTAIEELGNTTVETQIKDLDANEKSDIKAEYGQAEGDRQSIIGRLQEGIADHKKEVQSLRNQISRLGGEEESEIQSEHGRSKVRRQSIIKRLQKDIDDHKKEVQSLRSQRQEAEQMLSSTTLGGQRKSLSDLKNVELRTLAAKQNESQRKRDALTNQKKDEIRRILKSHEMELSPKEKAYNSNLQNIGEDAEKRRGEADAAKAKALKEFDRRDSELARIRDRISDLNKQYSADEEKRAKESLKTLVGQWAIRALGSPTPDNIRMVSLVWFGSIAAITAWTGTLLAFASLVLQYGPETRHHPKRGSRSRSVKALFIKSLRSPRIKEIEKVVEKPVEVIKEVPVTKVVTQEVPKEVIRKEVIHVPIASDDLTILDIKKKKRPKKKPKDDEDKESED